MNKRKTSFEIITFTTPKSMTFVQSKRSRKNTNNLIRHTFTHTYTHTETTWTNGKNQ